jgi:hypothetical protein
MTLVTQSQDFKRLKDSIEIISKEQAQKHEQAMK